MLTIILFIMKVIIDERETALYDKCQCWLSAQSKASYVDLSKEVLPIGDILLQTDEGKDVLLIERKSFSDLLSSIKDGRYEEQSYRLLHSSGFPPHSVLYLLEGLFSQLNKDSEKKMVYSAMTSLNFFKGFSVHRTSSLMESAQWLMLMADKIEREFLKGNPPYYLGRAYSRTFKAASFLPEMPVISTSNNNSNNNDNENNINNDIDNNNNDKQDSVLENAIEIAQEQVLNQRMVPRNQYCKETSDEPKDDISQPLTIGNYCTVVKKVKKDNVTPENIGEIILCQIPGISSITAMAIMKHFGSFPHLIEELQKNPQCIENLTVETNGKSRKISKSSLENIRLYLLKKNSNNSTSIENV